MRKIYSDYSAVAGASEATSTASVVSAAAFLLRERRVLAGFFAVAIVLALGFMGSMVQSNSIAGSMETVIDPNKTNILFSLGSYDVTVTAVVVGAIIALRSAFIFLGGI